MAEGQFGTRKRKILKMMALKRKKLKRRYAGRGDHNERLPHLPKFLKKIFCKSCNDGTHKRCIRPGESLDNYKCQRCDPRRQEVHRARANEVDEESWSCDICEFVSLFKANLKRHMREIHKKTVTEADLILKQMQTA